MGRKKKTPDEKKDNMLDQAQAKKPPTSDRHKGPRKQVALPPALHSVMQALADSEHRDLRQQVIVACHEHLARLGLWDDDFCVISDKGKDLVLSHQKKLAKQSEEDPSAN